MSAQCKVGGSDSLKLFIIEAQNACFLDIWQWNNQEKHCISPDPMGDILDNSPRRGSKTGNSGTRGGKKIRLDIH